MKKDKKGIIHGINIIADAIAEAEKNSAEAKAASEITAPETTAPEDVIYYALRDGGKDDAYLVHIDPAIFEGTSWTYQKVEVAVTGTHHVTEIASEHYNGEITAEVYVTLDSNGDLKIY